MDIQISALGAVLGLVIAIIMIFRKVPAFYALFVGALAGGLLGGADLIETGQLMTAGAQGMVTSILRILAAGVMAGILIQTGAAASIAQAIIHKIGKERALLAIAIATMILTMVGVFIDIAVITVAPIALEIGKELGYSRFTLLFAMIGGGKSGNIMSPNPNTIAVSDAFKVPLTDVMMAGIIPAIVGLIVTALIAKVLARQSSAGDSPELVSDQEVISSELPDLWKALIGPLVAIVLLALRPLFGIIIDPMFALPLGGLLGLLALGEITKVNAYIEYGLGKMINVAIILFGTGLIAGVISHSYLGDALTNSLSGLGLPAYILAPLSGILMSAATASTTSGSAVASSVFGSSLVQSGVAPLAAAAMLHAGATVLDHLPHGSFFHATAGSVTLDFKSRLKMIPLESLIGLTLIIVSTIIYGVFG